MLVSRFLETLERYPDRLAVQDPFRSLTFAKLATLSAALRRIVLANTARPHVGIMLPTSAGGLAGILGVLWAGKAIVPLNFLLQPEELARIVVDAGLDLVLTTKHFRHLQDGVPARFIELESAGLGWRYLVSKLGRRPAAPAVDAQEVAAIVYTSGTAAQPKGVCLTHGNLARNAEAVAEHLRIGPEQRMLGVLPNFHVYGLTVLNFVPVVRGTAAICLPRFSPLEMHRMMVRDRTDVVMAVPSMYAALAHQKGLRVGELDHVKIAVSGGEALPRKVYHQMAERAGLRLMEGYGLTETSPVISADLPWAHRLGTVGPALHGVRTQVRSPEGKLVSPGQEGELYVAGPFVMRGYYNRPQETAAVLSPDGWFRTGDAVRIDRDGYITITGRLKDIIIVAGENVSPGEVENVLELHPSVARAVVVGRPDPVRGEAVVAFVAAADGSEPNAAELRAFCREHLAGFKVPREVHVLESLPIGPTGKVLKRQLLAGLQ